MNTSNLIEAGVDADTGGFNQVSEIHQDVIDGHRVASAWPEEKFGTVRVNPSKRCRVNMFIVIDEVTAFGASPSNHPRLCYLRLGLSPFTPTHLFAFATRAKRGIFTVIHSEKI
jgi:hypothetical protein